MAAYITQSEYENMEGSAGDAAFQRLELKARRIIDAATHGRISNETPVRESVRMCAFELIEMMAADEARIGIGGKEIDSMSNDGVNIAYSTENGQNADARRRDIIRQWLLSETTANGTSLLYCGVDV